MNKKLPYLMALTLASSCLIGCGGGGNSSASTPASAPGSSASGSGESSTISSSVPAIIEDSLIVHYHRDDGDYKTWSLWLWPKGGDGKQYYFSETDDYGGICTEPLSTFGASVAGLEIGIIVRDPDWGKDVGEDRFIALDNLTPDDNGNYSVWLYTEVAEIYTKKPETVAFLRTCAFTDFRTLSFKVGAGTVYKVALYIEDSKVIEQAYDDGVKNGELTLPEDVLIDRPYTLEVTYENNYVARNAVSLAPLYDADVFVENYHFDGDLGALYTKEKTTFRVWSPASIAITLKLYDTGTPSKFASGSNTGSDTPYDSIPMVKGEKGVFEVSVDGDLDGKYYTYSVTNYLYKNAEIVDPYAKAVGVNGLRGMIIDLDRTNPSGWDDFMPAQIDRKALTVYETHIADLTSSATWNGQADKAKKYSGFHLSGTSYEGVSTGFDHVKELGVNAVQILPMFDQANDETNPTFNWGYNPLNYNAPEGVYSSDPYDGAVRIKELKELIRDYGNEGMNIIMDVVYNHVNSVTGQNFDVLMPYYYFRYDSSMGLTNGSGCGNETASNHSMFRKFMIDSTRYWAKEYKLGGFRFDLMGLHELKTMAELTEKVKEINPGIVIYGEPWTGGDTPLDKFQQASKANALSFKGYGAFNDRIRDGLIAGGLQAASTKAWATINSGSARGPASNVMAGIKGEQDGTSDPDVTVTYATCHDNYTLYDRVKAAHGDSLDNATAKKMNLLANSVVFTSQGTAFMLAGEEMLRTKGGNHNSYDASYEVNALDYARKKANLDLFEAYKALIQLKQQLPGLHLAKAEANELEVVRGSDSSTLTYVVAGKDGATYKICHANGGYKDTSDKIDFAGYDLVLDTVGGASLSAETAMKPFQTIVAKKA